MSRRRRKWENDMPTVQQLMQARTHERYRIRYRNAVRSTIVTLITVVAVAVIISYTLLPVLRIYGHSMTPTVTDGEIALAVRTSRFQKGDVVAFYYNNKILIKRVIAGPGDWVDLDEDGNVYVNDKRLVEPYVSDLAYGETNIEFPYQVPENRWFVMGDHRSVSIDSRNSAVGCVSDEQVVGRLMARIWPLNAFGLIERWAAIEVDRGALPETESESLTEADSENTTEAETADTEVTQSVENSADAAEGTIPEQTQVS